MRKRIIGLLVVITLLLSSLFAVPVSAANPIVTITVYGDIISITNSQPNWAIGHVSANTSATYWSATGSENDTYAYITNTGNQIVDIIIQGIDFEGGAYDWTLATAAGDKTYSLYANTSNGTATYTVEVKSAATYSTLTAAGGLSLNSTQNWSMKFTPPIIFDAGDPGAVKTATVTLVASVHP